MLLSSLLSAIAQLLLANIIFQSTITPVLGATTDPTCLSACSDWSVVLGYCRGQWSNTTAQNTDLSYMNGFLSCCCSGSESTQVLGNDTIIESAETCMGCSSTPSVIKANLATFTTLCAIQVQNGTASDALDFRPEAYTTSSDGLTVEGAATRRATLGAGVMTVPILLGAVVACIGFGLGSLF